MSAPAQPPGSTPRAGTLLIDAGNTRVKFGWREDGATSGQAVPRTPLQVAFRHEEVAEALLPWLDEADLRPRAAMGSNVAGDDSERTIAALLARNGCEVNWIRAGRRLLGVTNGYRHPERLGADRWLSLVGIWNRWHRQAAPGTPAPVHVLAHFGTATTVDTLDGAGRFVGGLILPGRDLMRRPARRACRAPTARSRPSPTTPATRSCPAWRRPRPAPWRASGWPHANASGRNRCWWPAAAPGRPSPEKSPT